MYGGKDKTIAQVSQYYAKAGGLMPELPTWLFNGAIVGLQGGTTKVQLSPGTLRRRRSGIDIWVFAPRANRIVIVYLE